MLKIALLTPMLQPYRLTFYEKLSTSNRDDIWVFYHGVKDIEDGRPAYSGVTSFRNVGLKEYKVRIGPFDIVVHKRLFSVIKDHNPDLIILQSIAGNISYRKVVSWAYKNGKKIIMWAPGWEPGRAKGLLLSFKNIFVRTFFRKSNLFLTYSTNASNYVKMKGIDLSKIRVCYNGIETDDMIIKESEVYSESKGIIEKYHLNDYTTFLYVGGLIKEKKILLLLKAFSKAKLEFKKIKLLIIGDGPLKSEVIKAIKTLNDPDVYYLGRILEGVDPYFAASDCLVMPGIGGLALNQAMFWRKVCIVSEADSTEDDLVIEGKTGFRFQKDDVASLVSALCKVVQCDKKELGHLGNNGHKIIMERNNVNAMVSTFRAAIRDIFDNV